ncbi:hypothetical protein HMF8227_00384 [Saliniradius amylolyticus]|uniref:DUF2884 family protein n=1 Tax=Saliniradius amylolyticus TaxID=2183582 RepID=A0A2S2E0T1_9ALTE|nr:DUF2884 family protein [Saliniradius amylolyticus]AWL10890.1 hypothetical protein HMF8227_00384 [Saliniradius amylolyticus]
MRLMALTFIALMSSSALAHDSDCDLTLNGDVTLKQGTLTASLNNNQSLKLDGQQAWLDGQALDLNDDQQALLNQYHSESLTLAPKVADIALDALDLANDGVTLAFGELFGPDDDLVMDLTQQIGQLRSDVHQQFYAEDGSIRFESKNFDEKYLNREFEQKLENTIEDAVSRSVGKMMMKIGQQMISGESSPEEFEHQMENFGERLEVQMEQKAGLVEQRASQLCSDFRALDDLERRIQNQIPELNGLDLIELRGKRLK